MAEKDGSGKLTKVYINDGEGVIGMVRYFYDDSGTLTHKQRLYYMYDALGSVSLVTGEDGKPLQEYLYAPYGSTYNTESDKNNALRFVGRYGGYADDDTGLIYFWHRWYDPQNGRWISRDPIGVRGGINLYGYTKNNVLNKIDKKGLQDLVLDPIGPINDYASRFGEWFDEDPLERIWDATEEARNIAGRFTVCMLIDWASDKGIEKVTGGKTPFFPITCLKCFFESMPIYTEDNDE